MSRLGEKLAALPGAPVDGVDRPDEFFTTRGLLRNPFPPARTIWPEVLYDQEEAVQRLTDAIGEVIGASPERRAIGILGGTGEGKTHFLRHARLEFETLCKGRALRFALVEFTAGSGKIQALVRSALEAADESCQGRGAPDFITAVIDAVCVLQGGPLRDDPLGAIHLSDLREALRGLAYAREPEPRPRARTPRFDFEALRSLFRRWLSGGALDTTERKHLRVTDRLGTGSMAVRVLTELFSFARSLGVLQGMLLCLDEIETLFVGAQKISSVQSFLLDLRYLFDEASRYSLLLLSAATSKGADYLQQVNQPVYQRLGFEQGARVQLRPIEGTLDAKNFALEYIREEHERWRKAPESSTRLAHPPEALLSDKEIADAYERAGGLLPARRISVSQSSMLDALHALVNEKHRHAATRAGPRSG